MCVNESLYFLENINFQEFQNIFGKSLNNYAKYLRSFMKVFELLLLFARVTRQHCWELHLKTLYGLAKYFFVYNMLNYARMTPVYISQMYDLEDRENDTENFVDSGYFSVNKTPLSFTAIGAGYAIEHENRSMKVLGGIKGIDNDANNLGKYFIIALEVNKIIQDFHNVFQIDDQNTKRDEHHELYSTFKTQNINFHDSNVSTILSRKKNI